MDEFIYFYYLITLAKSSINSWKLNRSKENNYSIPISSFRLKTVNILAFEYDINYKMFLELSLLGLKKIHSVPNLLKDISGNRFLNLLKCFFCTNLPCQAGSLAPALPGKPLSHLYIKYQIALDEEAPCPYTSLAWFSVFFIWLNFFQSIWHMPYAVSVACLATSWNVGPVRTKSLFHSCSVAGVQRQHMDTWSGSWGGYVHGEGPRLVCLLGGRGPCLPDKKEAGGHCKESTPLGARCSRECSWCLPGGQGGWALAAPLQSEFTLLVWEWTWRRVSVTPEPVLLRGGKMPPEWGKTGGNNQSLDLSEPLSI